MAHANKKGALAFYIVIALILGAITYVEFAIVEYQEVFAWLTRGLILTTLAVLSLIKFALVVAIYMHLRDDDPTYTGFFLSGMVIALASFIALSALFTVPSVVRALGQEADTNSAVYDETEVGDSQHDGEETGHGREEAGHHFDLAELENKGAFEYARVPSPKEQYTEFYLPAAEEASFTLRGSSTAGAAQAQTESAAQAAGDPAAASTDTAEVIEPNAAAAETTETGAASAAAEATEAPAEELAAQASSFDWQAVGEQTYTANCVSCHQAEGQGIPGAFPPLAGHIPNLYNAEGGRTYIINVVLYGLQGEINVLGQSYNGIMNPWAQLSDEEIAAALNHELNAWGNDALVTDFTPITPDEVAAERNKGLAPADVLSLRPEGSE